MLSCVYRFVSGVSFVAAITSLQVAGECRAQTRQVLLDTKFIEIGIGGRTASGNLSLDFNALNNEIKSFSSVRPFFSVGFEILGPPIGNANVVFGAQSELYLTPTIFDVDFPSFGNTRVNAVGKNYVSVTPYAGVDIPLGTSKQDGLRVRLFAGPTFADQRLLVEIDNNGNVEQQSSSRITVSPTIGVGVVTNVIIPDRQTLVIGGLLLNLEATGKITFPQNVPELGDIPLIGAVFRQDRNAEFSGELILRITPHVINPP
jgi:Bacterial type II and III secretion system protein